MRLLGRCAIAAVFVFAPLLFAAEPGLAAETEGTLRATNTVPPQPAVHPPAPPAAPTTVEAPANDSAAEITVSGFDPDPAKLQTDADLWWASYIYRR